MVDLSVTAANVRKLTSSGGLAGTSTELGTGGATATAGQVVYRDSADLYQFKLAQATSQAASAAYGIRLDGGADEQDAIVIRSGLYNPGGTVVVGQVYCVSAATAGAICPYGDLASGNYVTIIGVGITAASIFVNIIASGIAKP